MRKPQVFGKYLLLERLNTGGMAEVFVAKAFGVEGFERILAIKKILPTMAEDEEFITMFIDEARISVQLNHANIVHIHELGKYDETFYIAMEYVSGKDLRSLLETYRRRQEIMPTAQAVFIASKLAEGLDYAHSRKDMRGGPLGIIHRDITPQNILLSFDGEVKIIDFGIAKAANRSQRTQAGILKGKFGYMSPEQVLGLTLDGRSDIFALGVILYEMLTGERLFVGESDFSTLERIRSAPVPAPREFNPSIPVGLEKVVLRALARDADDRYPRGADFQEDLMRFLLAGDVVYSGRHLATFLHEAFAEDLRREEERMARFADISRPDQIEDSGVVGIDPGFAPAPPKRAPSRPAALRAAMTDDEVTPTRGERPGLTSSSREEDTQIVLATGEGILRRNEETDPRAMLPFPELQELPVTDNVRSPPPVGQDAGAGSPKSQVVIGNREVMDGATRVGPVPERKLIADPLASEQTRILAKPTGPSGASSAGSLGSGPVLSADRKIVPDPLAAPPSPSAGGSNPKGVPGVAGSGAGGAIKASTPPYGATSPSGAAGVVASRAGVGDRGAGTGDRGLGSGEPRGLGAEPPTMGDSLLPDIPSPTPSGQIPVVGSPPLKQVPAPAAGVPMLTAVPLRRSMRTRLRRNALARVGSIALVLVLLVGAVGGAYAMFRNRRAKANILIIALPEQGVQILLGGKPIRNGEVTPMTPGPYELVVSAPGYVTQRSQVQLKAGQVSSRVEVVLAAEEGEGQTDANGALVPLGKNAAKSFTAVFTSDEPGVEVFLDGQRVGVTPHARVEGLAQGKAYHFVARRNGFKAKLGEVRSKGEAEVKVPLALEKDSASARPGPSGRLVCSSRPDGASVFVDGQDSGRATPIYPADPLMLPVGKHRVVLRLGNLRSKPQDVQINAGEPARLSNVGLE